MLASEVCGSPNFCDQPWVAPNYKVNQRPSRQLKPPNTCALHYAIEQHPNQRRKDDVATPYNYHPIRLLHILNVEVGIEANEVRIAALLHGVIEDCSGPHQMHIELHPQSHEDIGSQSVHDSEHIGQCFRLEEKTRPGVVFLCTVSEMVLQCH